MPTRVVRYYRGKLIDRDYRKAFKYLHQAAKNGDKMAAYRVGLISFPKRHLVQLSYF